MDREGAVFGDVKQQKAPVGRKPRLRDAALHLVGREDGLQFAPFLGFGVVTDSHQVTSYLTIAFNGQPGRTAEVEVSAVGRELGECFQTVRFGNAAGAKYPVGIDEI